MLEALIPLLVLLLILFIIYWGVGIFFPGTPQRIVGIILGLIFLIKALQILNIRWLALILVPLFMLTGCMAPGPSYMPESSWGVSYSPGFGYGVGYSAPIYARPSYHYRGYDRGYYRHDGGHRGHHHHRH